MAARPSDRNEAEQYWDNAIRDLLTAASAHRLDQRFNSPDRWPGYYLARQRAIASAVQTKHSRGTYASPPKLTSAVIGSEKLLTARNGLLAGKPDHFDHHAVTEYKSALPDPSWPEAASLVDGYWRQLKLYSVLVGETVGWPVVVRIVSASGKVLEQNVNRSACDAEADAAIAGLQAMNRALERGCGSSALANPGQAACIQCQYQAICPSFWSWRASSPCPQLREPAARGTLESVDAGVDGDLYAATLQLEGRHGEDGPLSLALRKSVHGDLTACGAGSHIRIVHAQVRRDGRLRADISTCVFLEDELPELKCYGSA